MKYLTNKSFFWICIISVALVIWVGIYKYYITENYTFIVETSCNPETEECDHRDCSIEDECPPNNWEYFKTYQMPASEFKNCKNEDCADFCRNSSLCIPIEE